MNFPLRFKIDQPRKRLKPEEIYPSKIELLRLIIDALKDFGFRFNLFLPDSLDGETHSFVRLLDLELIIQPFTYYCSIKPWLQVFDSGSLRVGFSRLLKIMNDWIGSVPIGVKQGRG